MKRGEELLRWYLGPVSQRCDAWVQWTASVIAAAAKRCMRVISPCMHVQPSADLCALGRAARVRLLVRA